MRERASDIRCLRPWAEENHSRRPHGTLSAPSRVEASLGSEKSREGFNRFGAAYYSARVAKLAAATRANRLAPSLPFVLERREALPFDNGAPGSFALHPSDEVRRHGGFPNRKHGYRLEPCQRLSSILVARAVIVVQHLSNHATPRFRYVRKPLERVGETALFDDLARAGCLLVHTCPCSIL
jgi:hypothetical protein